MYFDPQEAETVKQRIESGKPFSIRDRHVLNALEGDQKAITPIFAKVFPDKLTIKTEKSISELLDELDGQQTVEQTVANQPLISDSEQAGATDSIPTEPSAS